MRDTFTTLTTSPASPVDEGTAVTLNALIKAGPGPDTDGKILAGTVQFKDGDTNIGTPVPVRVAAFDGTASTTASTLTVRSHQLTAMSTPTNPTAFTSSTSNTVRVEVEGGDDSGDG